MSDAGNDQKQDIDSLLASIRSEIGELTPPANLDARKDRRQPLISVQSLAVDDQIALPERKTYSLDDFDALDEESFLHSAYHIVLGRDVDSSGLEHFLPALRNGTATPIGILGGLRYSVEGNARGVEIAGLKKAFFLDRLSRVGILKRLTGPLVRQIRLGGTLRRLQRRIAAADLRERGMVRDVNASLATVRRSLINLEREVVEAKTLATKAMQETELALLELAANRQQMTSQSLVMARLRDKVATEAGVVQIADIEAVQANDLDSFYVEFENRFRGSTELISKRLERYLDLFKQTKPVQAGGTVLDIGCGRGEFLSLLGKANIVARGIDMNGAMVAASQSQGLEVIEGDAIQHLRSLPENSLSAVTGFHIVEHVGFRDLVGLFDAAYGALSEDGIILFETPNPENLVVGACTFNYDPTHNKPLPPDYLRFVAEARGFTDVRIIRKDSDCDLSKPESGFAPENVNDWFAQPLDYAVYGRKGSVISGGGQS